MTMTTEREKCTIKASKGFLFQLLLSVHGRNQLLPSESFLYEKNTQFNQAMQM